MLYRYCTRVAYMKNYCQGEGHRVALPCAALDLHLRVIAGGDWASLPPASAKAVLRSTRWKGRASTMRSDVGEAKKYNSLDARQIQQCVPRKVGVHLCQEGAAFHSECVYREKSCCFLDECPCCSCLGFAEVQLSIATRNRLIPVRNMPRSEIFMNLHTSRRGPVIDSSRIVGSSGVSDLFYRAVILE